MTDVEYLVRDMAGEVIARLRTERTGAIPVVEPWMLSGIANRGWRIERWESRATGGIPVQTHGYADWKAVAESLNEVLKEVVAQVDPISDEDWAALSTEEQEFHNERTERLRAAMENYDMAQFEVMVFNPLGIEPEPSESDD